MNNTRRQRLTLQQNYVKVDPIIKNPSSITLDNAKLMLINGYRTKDLLTKFNILPEDKIELFKYEEILLKTDDFQQIKSTADNKKHELRFITKKNEYQNSLIDRIAKDVRDIFSSNKELRNFALISR